jgi:hypothetical protein
VGHEVGAVDPGVGDRYQHVATVHSARVEARDAQQPGDVRVRAQWGVPRTDRTRLNSRVGEHGDDLGAARCSPLRSRSRPRHALQQRLLVILLYPAADEEGGLFGTLLECQGRAQIALRLDLDR